MTTRINQKIVLELCSTKFFSIIQHNPVCEDVFSTRKQNPSIQIKEQQAKLFWKSDNHTAIMKPDIVISNHNIKQNFVLDTKWKCPDYQKPSIDDLRQLYTYHHYYQAEKVALVYPSQSEIKTVSGNYEKKHNDEKAKSCSLLFIHTLDCYQDLYDWQKHITKQIFAWCEQN